MGLLGTESKATQEMLLKVQSALALTQGLASIKEMGASFTALRAVIVGQVIPSIAAMGTATIVATGGVVLVLGAIIASVMMYTDSLDKEANALKLVTDEQARNNKAIADTNKVLIETQNLRTRSLKDGLEKDLRLNKDKLVTELNDNEQAYADGEIGLVSYSLRKSYIQDFYANEEEKIRKAANLKKIEDDKKAAALELQNLKIQLAQVVDIKSQFQGGGQSNLPGLKAPLAPTTPILSNRNSPANQIRKQTEDTRNAMIASKIILEEGIENMYSGLQQISSNAIANIFGSVGKTIGDSLAASLSGESVDMMDAIGVAIVKSLGQMAVQVGSMLIAMSVPMIIAGIPQGYAYALAGAGLIAVGATVSGLAGRKSQGGTQPSPGNNTPTSNMSPNSNYIGGNNSGNLVISGYVRGNDINFVNGKTGSKNNRNLRFG
jgi:hypothetical protein